MNSNYSKPVNLGNPEEHSVMEFARIIKNLVGGESRIEKRPAMQDDPQRRKPDITKARKYLNWQPKVPMIVGLNRTVAYFRNELRRSTHSQRNFHPPDLM